MSFVSPLTFGTFNDYVPPTPPIKVKPGEVYPGLICGIFKAVQDAYNADSKSTEGIAYLVVLRDDEDKLVFKATKVMTLGNWSFGSNATYGNFVRGMLQSTNVDRALLDECKEKGVADPALWVGKPCNVRFTGKSSKTSGKTYYALDSISSPSKYVPGLEEVPNDAPDCVLTDAFSSFVHPQTSGYIVMPNVKVILPSNDKQQTQQTQQPQQPSNPPACAVNMQALNDNEVFLY